MAVEEDTGLAEEASCRCAVAEAAETPDVKRQDLEADQSTTYKKRTASGSSCSVLSHVPQKNRIPRSRRSLPFQLKIVPHLFQSPAVIIEGKKCLAWNFSQLR